jgi:hypothetical protein
MRWGGLYYIQEKIARQLTDFGLNPESTIIRLLSYLIDLEPFCVRSVVLITSSRSAVSQVSDQGSRFVYPLKSL